MSNDWKQQPNNQTVKNNGNGASPHTGDLSQGYRQPPPQNPPNNQNNYQGYQQFSPASAPASQPLRPPQSYTGRPEPQSPMPQMPAPFQQMSPNFPFPPQPLPHTQDLGKQGMWQQQPQQGFVGNAMQMVRQWSGKMAATRGGTGTVPPPMVLYKDTKPVLPTQPKRMRWKRSRTLRVSMQMRHRRERWQSKSPTGGRIGMGIGITFLLLIVVVLSSASAYAYGYYQSQLPRLQGIANQQVSQTTHIYDRNGVPLYDSYDQYGRRTPVSYSQIPQVMRDAMVAAEDHTFWTNAGVDPQGILRAATQYSQAGSVQSGGSTITQQLIKNLTHNDDVSINRKLPEAALAIGLTQQYPKEKILEMYLNVAPFGSQDLGVEAAVEEYFHLNRSCDNNFKCTPGIVKLERNQKGQIDPILGLARASLLAGMPQNPVNYDPTVKENMPAALARQDYVLHQMKDLNMLVDGKPITDAMILQAEKLTKSMTFKPYQHAKKAPHFVDWVVSQLETQLGVPTFLTGGFNIYTTIDANLEDYVERAVQRHLQQPEYQFFPYPAHISQLNTDSNLNDSAVVVMDAKTGEVLAMNGSVNYNSTVKDEGGQFNAALAARQPGSTWKPIVYATAFEMGWYPGIVLPDVKTYFPSDGGPLASNNYHPTDYGNTYHNWHGAQASVRNDIANSINISAIKALSFAGVDNVANTARRFGITALDSDLAQAPGHPKTVSAYIGPSFALGTMEVPLLQMVGAYQVFADNGTRVPPQSVLDIWDNYGHHIYHYDPAHPKGIQVISPQIAYMMTSVLSDEVARAPEFAPDHVLSFWDGYGNNDPTYPDVAAKTGTTDSFKDNWTIGYTSNVVVGVWSGNATNTPMAYNVVGITGAAPIWHSVIERVSGKCPANYTYPFGDNIDCGAYKSPYTIQKFMPPAGVVQAAVSGNDGLQGSGQFDWMLDGEQPMQSGYAGATCTATNNGTPGNNGNPPGGTTTACPPGSGGNGNGNGNNGNGNNGNGNGNGNNG